MVSLSVGVAISCVLWTWRFDRRLKPEDISGADARAETVQKFRNGGFCFTALQFVVFFGFLAIVQPERDTFFNDGGLLFLTLLLAQGHAGFSVEKRLRGLQVGHLQIFWQAIRGILFSACMYGIYFLVTSGAPRLMALAVTRFSLSSDAIELLIVAATVMGVLTGLSLLVLIAPLSVRILLPCSRLEEPRVLQCLERCFERAGLKCPAPWVIHLDRFKFHNAMVCGFQSGKGWFRPAVFVSNSLIQKLSQEELEAVILHEASHISLNHIPKRMLAGFAAFCAGFAPLLIVITLLSNVLSHNLLLPSLLMSLLLNAAAQIYVLSQVVRRQELEADENAIVLGADIDELSRALVKLTTLNDQSSRKKDLASRFSAASAHPCTEERIAILRHREANGFPPRPSVWKDLYSPLAVHARIAVPLLTSLLMATGFFYFSYAKPRTAIRAALTRGDLQELREIYDSGRGPGVRDEDSGGNFPLSLAASQGHVPIVRYLLEAGADVNQRHSLRGFTALMAAAYYGHNEVVRLLVQNGAKLNARSSSGQTALITAAYGGRIDTIKLLLELGADVRQKDFHRSTALTVASERGHLEAVRVLLKNGAEVEAKDSDGDTSLGMAVAKNHEEIAKLLRAAGARDLGRSQNHPERALASQGH